MLALQITSPKNFMGAMLAGELFDSFLLEEASIVTAVSYTMDGRIRRDFYPPEEREDAQLHPYDFIPWKDIKGTCYDLIKGKNTPLGFHFVLQLIPSYTADMVAKSAPALSSFVKAFVLNIRFDGEKILLCTGTSYHSFVADKEAEKLWDAAFRQFLHKKEIACEEL